MLEGECLNEFLDSGTELALVPPGVYASDVGDDGLEELADLVKAGFIFVCD